MVRRIIDAPAPAGTSPHAPRAGVQRVNVDEGGAGQRLDNFLLRLLKGVPKTHVYRVIRSGEVRVNRGRASADTRLALGDEVRVPPVRYSGTGRLVMIARVFAKVIRLLHWTDAFCSAMTLSAAKLMDYPPDRLTVWLLDDGGTDGKCSEIGRAHV